MKQIVFHCEADVEFTAAAKFYACTRPELARDFVRAVRMAKEAIARQPDRFSFLEKPVRRVSIAGFPYRIVYEELDDCVQIIAIMHDGREPGYWKNRLS